MSTQPKPCTVKHCAAKTTHHHFTGAEIPPTSFCADDFCWRGSRADIVGPRATKSALIAALEAEVLKLREAAERRVRP